MWTSYTETCYNQHSVGLTGGLDTMNEKKGEKISGIYICQGSYIKHRFKFCLLPPWRTRTWSKRRLTMVVGAYSPKFPFPRTLYLFPLRHMPRLCIGGTAKKYAPNASPTPTNSIGIPGKSSTNSMVVLRIFAATRAKKTGNLLRMSIIWWPRRTRLSIGWKKLWRNDSQRNQRTYRPRHPLPRSVWQISIPHGKERKKRR